MRDRSSQRICVRIAAIAVTCIVPGVGLIVFATDQHSPAMRTIALSLLDAGSVSLVLAYLTWQMLAVLDEIRACLDHLASKERSLETALRIGRQLGSISLEEPGNVRRMRRD